MARKGVLMSDPSVRNMTQTQWMFEYHALFERDKTYFEAFGRILKNVLVATLGLKAIRPEDANGSPKKFEDMTDEEKESFMPLVAWVAHPEMLKKVSAQLEDESVVEKATSDKAYEDMVSALDKAVAAGEDMEPIIGIDHIKVPANPRLEIDKKLVGVKDLKEFDVEGDL